MSARAMLAAIAKRVLVSVVAMAASSFQKESGGTIKTYAELLLEDY